MTPPILEKPMHAFTRLRDDVDLFRIWYVAMGVTVMYTIMNLAYGEYINGWLLVRGLPETVLALLAAGGRRWARVLLGVMLAIPASAACALLAMGNIDLVHQVVYAVYAAGMSLAAAKAFRWI